MTLIITGACIGTAIGFVGGTFFGAVLWRISQSDAYGDMIHVFEPSEDDDDDDDADFNPDAWKRGRGGYGRG